MNISLWRYNTTIEGETVRSPKSFVSREEAIKYVVDSAVAVSRLFRGGKDTAVSSPISPDVNTVVVLVHDNDNEVARFELNKIQTDDSLVRFKMGHPYVHEALAL